MGIEFDGLCPLLQVYDMPASLAFYVGVLGFESVAASDEVDTPEGRFAHWAWLRRGSAELMLNTAYDEGERPPERVAAQQRWHHDICLYLGGRDLDAAHAALIAGGVEVSPPSETAYGMRQLYFSDPDGYMLCLQHRA